MSLEQKPGTTSPAMPDALAAWATEKAIVSLIHCAARVSDEQRYLDWRALFTEDGEYSAITQENYTYKGLRLFKDVGQSALHERVAFLMGVLQTPRGKTLHLVSNIEVTTGETPDTATARSHFLLTRTSELEHTVLHAAGIYLDRFERRDGRWLFKSREVIVDTNLLPATFTELL